jgi:general secretion pathway protein N
MTRLGGMLGVVLGGVALAAPIAVPFAVPGIVLAASNTGVDSELRNAPAGPLDPGLRMSDAVKAPVAHAGNPLWAVPLSALTLTRERPLFSASRRPPPPVVAPPPVAVVRPPPPPQRPREPEKPRLSLVGTVGGEDGIAVFVDQTNQAIVRLRTGEGHQGWILRAVGGRAVTLQNDRDTAILALPTPDGR